MANTVRMKRSSVAAKIPATTDLQLGELAINTNDGRLFSKKNVSSVDTIIEFLSTDSAFKTNVRAATTAAITLSGAQTIDGVICAAGDRVLVKNQTSTAENGIYIVQTGTWTRATDADAAAEVAGAIVPVSQGSTNGGQAFTTTFKGNNVLGTDAMTWAALGSGSSGGGGSGSGVSVTISDTAPSSPTAGSLWWDSTYGILKIYYSDGDTSQWVEASGSGGVAAKAESLNQSTINFTIDGSGSAITTGIKGDVEVPFPCTIDQWTLLADQSGSIVVDIWKDTYANYPPTSTDVITASAKPTLSSATKAQSSTLTGWTTSIAAGDILRFNVNSAATVQRVTLSLKVTRL